MHPAVGPSCLHRSTHDRLSMQQNRQAKRRRRSRTHATVAITTMELSDHPGQTIWRNGAAELDDTNADECLR